MAKRRGQQSLVLAPLPVGQGGLGSVPAAGNLLLGNGSQPIVQVAPPPNKHSLRTNSDGTAWTTAPECALLQVVSSSYSTAIACTSSTWMFAGLQGAIVTKLANSKILMLVNVAGCGRTSTVSTWGNLAIHRNGTSIHNFGFPFGYLEEPYDCSVGSIDTNYLDTPNVPAGTSLNYQLWVANVPSTGIVTLHWANLCTSTMTLMEVAA